MLVQPAHAVVLATCLRNLGWRPVAELAGASGPIGRAGPRLAVPAFPARGGSRLGDPAIWQWWALADEAAWCGEPQRSELAGMCLRRVLTVALGDASLAEVILAHGPDWAPVPAATGAAPSQARSGGSVLAEGVPAAPAKE